MRQIILLFLLFCLEACRHNMYKASFLQLPNTMCICLSATITATALQTNEAMLQACTGMCKWSDKRILMWRCSQQVRLVSVRPYFNHYRQR